MFKIIETKQGYVIKTKDGCKLGGITKFPDGLPVTQQVKELINKIRS
jgi:hypothetical protein